jgi:hypothetical protein
MNFSVIAKADLILSPAVKNFNEAPEVEKV